MILDLDGAPPGREVRAGLALSIASAAVAAAALLVVNALPHEAPRAAQQTARSVLAQAQLHPRPPRLALELPRDIAIGIPTSLLASEGNRLASPTLRSYRMRDSGAIVTVVMIPDAPAVFRPSGAPGDALSVHGNYAAGYTVEATSVSVVRWTEHEITYEISARSLRPSELARIAEQLR